jgi:hypothetical protein
MIVERHLQALASSTPARTATPSQIISLHSITRSPSPSPAFASTIGPSRVSTPTPPYNSARGNSAASTLESCISTHLQRLLRVLQDVRTMGPERLKIFLMWHLPGSSQAMWSSPYTDLDVFEILMRDNRCAHVYAAKIHKFTASHPIIGVFRCRQSGENPLFVLDCSSMVEDARAAAGSTSSGKNDFSIKFHPNLPLAVCSFPGHSCIVLHSRNG